MPGMIPSFTPSHSCWHLRPTRLGVPTAFHSCFVVAAACDGELAIFEMHRGGE